MSGDTLSSAPTPAGVLVVDKDKGFTSMDVCAIVRTRFRRGGAPKRLKVGHAGTLDPMATGVLVVLVGKATRLSDRMMLGEKEYLAEVDLSRRSDTDDVEGRVEDVAVANPPDEAAVRAALAGFVGEIMQKPPAFSALKVGGKRSYDLARAGKAVELAARPVVIHECRLEAYAWPLAKVWVRCGKGTYIRSLARDVGTALGCGGMLTALRRTRVGAWTEAMARRIDTLPDVMTQADLRDVTE
ncbi:MAG: tRNA pseudouridine(55) synthase TruB [Tepidisphaera sp.]|nr:tRNA pseudouridine(55) synthase TruB [Tepidisphaera sp.]